MNVEQRQKIKILRFMGVILNIIICGVMLRWTPIVAILCLMHNLESPSFTGMNFMQADAMKTTIMTHFIIDMFHPFLMLQTNEDL